jgi:hypothetical protein
VSATRERYIHLIPQSAAYYRNDTTQRDLSEGVGEEFLKLERIDGLIMLKLDLGHGQSVTFLQEWVDKLRTLSVGEYGGFMRDTIYPALPARDRRSWHNSKISNQDLFHAIQTFKNPPKE